MNSMKTSQRFEQAIQKLYTAFHNGHLNPECSKQCAVGNILDNRDAWNHCTDMHGSGQLNYVGIVNENFGKKFNGYSPLELLQIEAAFLKGCGYSLPLNGHGRKPTNPFSKDTLFNGLCATVGFLCLLDGIKDVMDCNRIFHFKEETLSVL